MISRDKMERIIWEEGPYKEFTYRGVKCFICRKPLGHLCGYVTIRRDVKRALRKSNPVLKVHGGITYDGPLGDVYLTMIKDRNIHVIGFNCAHLTLHDYVPLLEHHEEDTPLNYRTMEFVENECKSLVDQLLELVEVKQS